MCFKLLLVLGFSSFLVPCLVQRSKYFCLNMIWAKQVTCGTSAASGEERQYETPALLQLAFSSYVQLRWQGLILDGLAQGPHAPMSFQISQLKPRAAAVSTCWCGSFTRCSELITLNSIWSVSWYRLSPTRVAVYLLPPTLPDIHTKKKEAKIATATGNTTSNFAALCLTLWQMSYSLHAYFSGP